MKRDDNSLDSTLDRHMGLAGEPPAGQVTSSVEAVWEQLRSEAECSMLPAREIVTRRSHFTIAAALLVVTMVIGLYAAQRAGLLQVMLPSQRPAPPQVAAASQSPAVSVNPVREPATIETVAGSREPVGPSEPLQASTSAAEDVARLQSTDAGNVRLQSVGAAFPVITTQQIDGKYSQGTTTTAPLAFEVASIRPVPLPLTIPIGAGPWTVSNGQFRTEIAFVRGVIAWAYEVMPPQVKGGPDWIDREPYDFDARARSAAAGPNQIRMMGQTLLTERFKLAVHRQTEEAPVYRLVVSKSGSKLQKADGQRNYINWTGRGQVTFSENTTLLGLRNILSSLLGVPVLDDTGLNGTYNFSLEFTRPQDTRPRQADSPPDLFTALQKQLGLELRATRGPVEVVVIDHIERPSPN
jgi:uncharacterized protein (TIGR03435 family)